MRPHGVKDGAQCADHKDMDTLDDDMQDTTAEAVREAAQSQAWAAEAARFLAAAALMGVAVQ